MQSGALRRRAERAAFSLLSLQRGRKPQRGVRLPLQPLLTSSRSIA